MSNRKRWKRCPLSHNWDVRTITSDDQALFDEILNSILVGPIPTIKLTTPN